MSTNSKSRSASLTSNSSSTLRHITAEIPAMANPRSRRNSSASKTQIRPPLTRASSSTASLIDYSSLKATCFGGYDSYIGKTEVNLYCQMLPRTLIEEEQYRHAHKAMHSDRCTVSFGLLALDKKYNRPYEIGGLAQSTLLREALESLVCRYSVLGCTLSITATIDSSGIGSNKSYDINSIVRSAGITAHPLPVDMSNCYGYGTEALPALHDLAPRNSRADVVIRLKQLVGIEMDVSPKAHDVVKKGAYICKVQYRLTATSQTLGDLVIPSSSRKAILVKALTALTYNRDTRETGALFDGSGQVKDGKLCAVDWATGSWLPITKERSGF